MFSRTLSWHAILLFLLTISFEVQAEDGSLAKVTELTTEEKAWVGEHPTFRVAATPDWPPFEVHEDDGAYSGISADFIRLAAQKVGLVPIPHFNKWKSLLEKLKNRDLDVAPGLNETDDRKKFLTFSNYFVEQYSVIFTTNDNDDFSTIDDLSGKTVAVEKGYALAEVIARDYPKVKLLLVGNSFEAIQKVSLKQADAYIGNQVVGSYLTKKNMITNIRAVGFFPGKHGQLRFGIRKDWPILRDVLNKGLAAITTEERNAILTTYIDVDSGLRQKTVSLTDHERDWVKTHPVIRVAANTAFPPMEYFDEKGIYKGYTADLLRILAERIGVKIEPIKMGKLKAGNAYFRSDKADILGMTVKTNEPIDGLIQSDKYQTFPSVILVPASMTQEITLEEMKDLKIAAVTGSAEASYLKFNYPDLNLMLVSDSRTGLNQLAFGHFDAFVALLPTASYIIQEEGITSLRVGGRLPVAFSYAFAIRQDMPEFVNLLNKALSSISQAEEKELLASWISLNVQDGLDIWLVVKWGGAIGGGALLIIVLIIFWNRRLGAEIEQRKRTERKLQFTQYAVDHAAESIYWVRANDGGLDYINDTACANLGYSREEFMTMHIPQIDIDFQAEKLPELLNMLTEQRFATFESRHQKKNGDIIDVEVRAYLADNEGRQVLVASTMDITERKKAAKALADAHQKLGNAMGHIEGSINYASRIQRSVLPDETMFSSIFKDHFILWHPRDVVGGDIYWASLWGSGVVIILGDCTGHGVPGAFMTLITTGAMERALIETEEGNVGEFLQRIHQMVQVTLGQHEQESESDDGMELGICFFPPDGGTMHFASARFDLYVIEDGEITIIKPTKSGIGYRGIPFDQAYDEHNIVIYSGQSIYMTSDGLIDQVGGERGRSFGKKRFKELLLSVQHMPMADQKDEIYRSLVEYQGAENRRDDVSAMGFKI